MSYKIVNMWTPKSKWAIKATYPMKPTTITVHNTANTARARGEASYMNSNNNYTSYHVAVDDKEVVQLIPFNRNAWHAGNLTGNRTSIGVEICYSMDNGYNGSKSERYKQAEDNAATYIAHVLTQYGWGVDRVRKHEDWSGKYCPHKMLSTNSWRDFLRLIQRKMDEINGDKKTSKQVTKKVKKQRNTYIVRKGDTLWGIANDHGITVSQLKSLNNLRSNVLQIGQKLTVVKPKSEPKKPNTDWDWSGTFTSNSSIVVRRGYPSLKSKKVPSNSYLRKGDWVNFDHLFYKDGYWWIRFKYSTKGSSTAYFFAPVGKKETGIGFSSANQKGRLWGEVTKLNSGATSGVKSWYTKGAVNHH
ncbi:N-acetylmuramoyl-L-alanine amidase [Abyssicoccus albus]|uniref:N-acetylmuramoyl-L-alanine amidase n=1 Tax=Abyssicoccus albus TaxID=1817405 RepID=A0A3N5CCL5_9BACL|nr:N-acetylmuramoyl-L-alanine amidase [Abyssicoccus albus]RPF54721.1 SH3 domain-containing protein [Abyssicoccus albus]